MKIHKLLAALVALAIAHSAMADAPIKIAVTGPFSGPSSPMGLSMLAGVRLAFEEINQGGGLIGRTVELVERDDKGDPATGKAVVEAVINQDKVVAGLGFINTGVALAAQKLYQDARIPVINNVSTGSNNTRQFLPPNYPDNYVFRNSASDIIQSAMIVGEAIDRRNFRKVAIFCDTTAYGEQGRQQLIDQLAKRNLEPVAVTGFKLGVKTLTAELQRAKDAGAEVILAYGIGPELAVIANDRARIGWKVPLIGSWPMSLPNFIGAAGSNAEGARMPQTFIEAPNNYRRLAFISAYYAANPGQHMESAVSAAQGYDSALLLAYAIIQAGSTDGPAIRAALEDLRKPVYGVITTYAHPFTHDDHEAISENMVVMGEVRNGKIAYAYPADERRSLLVHRKPGN